MLVYYVGFEVEHGSGDDSQGRSFYLCHLCLIFVGGLVLLNGEPNSLHPLAFRSVFMIFQA